MILLKINNKIITEHNFKIEDFKGCMNEGVYYNIEGTYIATKNYKHATRINITHKGDIYSILICNNDDTQCDYIKTWKGVKI